MFLRLGFLSVVFTTFVAAACANVDPVYSSSVDTTCKNADNRTQVKGGDECLVIRTFDEQLATERPILVVFLHGDKSSGRPISWEYRTTALFANAHTVSVALLRPGYVDAFGNRSTGDHFGRRDSYTAHNINAVAQAIQTLKAHHKAVKLVLVGYSGGAAYAGVILGRYPGLAEGAVLVACACNIDDWRSYNDWGPWDRSLSPHTYINRVPQTTRVIAVTGTDDVNTDAQLAEEYVKKLRKKGVVAEFRPASGATHNSVPRSQVFLGAVNDLIKTFVMLSGKPPKR